MRPELQIFIADFQNSRIPGFCFGKTDNTPSEHLEFSICAHPDLWRKSNGILVYIYTHIYVYICMVAAQGFGGDVSLGPTVIPRQRSRARG